MRGIKNGSEGLVVLFYRGKDGASGRADSIIIGRSPWFLAKWLDVLETDIIKHPTSIFDEDPA